MMTMTPERIAAMAPVALTYPGSEVVNVRMQTEHLYSIEQDLAQRGVPTDLITQYFDGLHRCPPLPVDTWLAAITEAYNQAVRAATDH